MIEIKSLGLSPKFTQWRDNQEEIVQRIYDGLKEHKFFLLDAPTGIGKSIIALSVASLFIQEDQVMDKLSTGNFDRPHCIYVCRTKQLQEQILHDFPKAKSIIGRANFPCALMPDKFPEVSAEDCIKKICTRRDECLYRKSKKEALNAPISILNSVYFLTEANGVGQFSNADFLILDEVDSMESDMMNYVKLNFNSRTISYNRLPDIPGATWEDNCWKTDINKWYEWAHKCLVIIEKRCNSLSQQLALVSDFTMEDIRSYKNLNKLEQLKQKLVRLIDEVNLNNWVLAVREDEKGNREYTFKPIFISSYSDYFLKHGKRILGMSGTILDASMLANNLGIRDYDYLSVSSPYPVEHRPILYTPAANLTRATMAKEVPKIVDAVNTIANYYPMEKILVHTTSYILRDALRYSLDLSRVLTHGPDDRIEMLRKFKDGREPFIMLSPSFDRGIDLPYDACRVIIIAKVPYPDMNDPQVRARMRFQDGNSWYLMHTIQTIIQMSGRGVRAADDFCVCYILDEQFQKLYSRANNLFPMWWKVALYPYFLNEQALNKLSMPVIGINKHIVAISS